MHKPKRTRFGFAEDLRGADVTWTIGDRTYLCRVESIYAHPVRNATMLRTRHFNGEQGPEVAAMAVMVLDRDEQR